MPLFRRDGLSPEAQRVLDPLRMTNSSPNFDDEKALRYMEENREHFARDVASIVRDLPVKIESK